MTEYRFVILLVRRLDESECDDAAGEGRVDGKVVGPDADAMVVMLVKGVERVRVGRVSLLVSIEQYTGSRSECATARLVQLHRLRCTTSLVIRLYFESRAKG